MVYRSLQTIRRKYGRIVIQSPYAHLTAYIFSLHKSGSHKTENEMRYLAFEKFVGGTALALGFIMLVGMNV